MEISEFLLARIAEDESRARYALSRDDGGALEYGGQWYGAVQHARRWEPERVLVECGTKRGLVTGLRLLIDSAATMPLVPFTDMRKYTERVMAEGEANLAGMVLRILAAPHSNHPDYQQEWKP